MQNLGMFYSVQVLLRYVGDLRCRSVSCVYQHSIVWLVPPPRMFMMHLSQPVLWSSGLLVPANDDPPVPPAFMFDDLPNSELDMRGPRGSRFDALSEISVLISKHENLFSRTFTIGIIQSVWIENISYITGKNSLTPHSPGIQPQPRVSHLIELIDELGDGVGPAGLCAAHVGGYKHLERNTHHYHSKLNMFSLERHLLFSLSLSLVTRI